MTQQQAQIERKSSRREDPPPAEAAASPAVTEKGKKLKADLDKLMDEVDQVLVENAAEFARSYVQKGGE